MSGVHVVCSGCGQVNRVAQDKPAAEARCGRCGEALFDGRPHEVDAAGLERQMTRSGLPLVVDFWAGWCGPCRAMAPAFEKVAAKLETKAKFLKVDVDANPEAAAQIRRQGHPGLVRAARRQGDGATGRRDGPCEPGALGARGRRHRFLRLPDKARIASRGIGMLA